MNEIQQKVWHEERRKTSSTSSSRPRAESSWTSLLGVNFITITSWTDDVEATDWYCDGVVVRVPNQIMNAYFSPLVENGILRGYGMNFYDATAKEGWCRREDRARRPLASHGGQSGEVA